MDHKNTIYIISDLHLSLGHLETYDIFENFIKEIASHDNSLFILGDFFNYWIGDDHRDPFYTKITNTLKAASHQGLQIYFMHGNRDFLASKQFEKNSGITIIKDPYYFNIKKDEHILLTHGDLFCTDDISYQRYRKYIAYNKVLRFLFRNLPLFIREKIADKTRNHSSTKNRYMPDVDVTLEGIEKYRRGCNIIIHGHTHRMNIHKEKDYTRYVLGDWFKDGNYIKIDSEGEITQVETLIN